MVSAPYFFPSKDKTTQKAALLVSSGAQKDNVQTRFTEKRLLQTNNGDTEAHGRSSGDSPAKENLVGVIGGPRPEPLPRKKIRRLWCGGAPLLPLHHTASRACLVN